MPEISIYEGNTYSDSRGKISFVNDFKFEGVKRAYHVMHPDAAVVRAWQGHRMEHKYFFVPHGKFLLAWVLIDDWSMPSMHLKASYTLLSEDEPRIIGIPPGYANGIKAITPHAVLSIYSDLSLEESEKDRWQFDQALWLDWSLF